VIKPLESRARFVVVVLVVIALVDDVAVWIDWDRYDLLDRIINNGRYTIGEADTSDSRQAAIGVLQLALLALGAAGFVFWFVRAYRNVDALGGSRRFSVKWAGWSWFVPILSLWRPKQIANDIWRTSDPQRPQQNPDEDERVPRWVTAWWACWLLATWAGQIGGRLSFHGDDAESLRSATGAFLVSDAVEIVAAALAILFVRRVTTRQHERAERRVAMGTIA